MPDLSLDPSPLTHSWPLFERDRRFDLGVAFDWPAAATGDPMLDDLLQARAGLGAWHCDLVDDGIDWSAGVYDLFGLPQGTAVTRAEALSLYAEPSRATLERLRGHAIRHRRGFTLDVELRPADGARRWMRIVAAPVIERQKTIRLHGFKRDVTRDYV